MPYSYQAELFCDSCGQSIRRRLNPAMATVPGFDPRDETTFDSDDYPKAAGGDIESDTIDHCGSGAACLEAIDLKECGLRPMDRLEGMETRQVGAIVTDVLSSYGESYFRTKWAEIQRDGTPYQRALVEYWRQFFPEVALPDTDSEAQQLAKGGK